MENKKSYSVANPGLKLIMLRAELTQSSIDTYSSKNGVQEEFLDKLPYSDISSINIAKTDIDRTRILIKTTSRKQLSLISLSQAKLKNGKLRREIVDQKAEFNLWIGELHKILVEKDLSDKIDFSEGSDSKLVLLVMLLALSLFAIYAAFTIGRIGLLATALGGAILSAVLLFTMGPKRAYIPESKIPDYTGIR